MAGSPREGWMHTAAGGDGVMALIPPRIEARTRAIDAGVRAWHGGLTPDEGGGTSGSGRGSRPATPTSRTGCSTSWPSIRPRRAGASGGRCSSWRSSTPPPTGCRCSSRRAREQQRRAVPALRVRGDAGRRGAGRRPTRVVHAPRSGGGGVVAPPGRRQDPPAAPGPRRARIHRPSRRPPEIGGILWA